MLAEEIRSVFTSNLGAESKSMVYISWEVFAHVSQKDWVQNRKKQKVVKAICHKMLSPAMPAVPCEHIAYV